MSRPLPKPRVLGTTAALRELARTGGDIWLPINMSRLGKAAGYAGLGGRYTARSEGGGVRVWLLPTP